MKKKQRKSKDGFIWVSYSDLSTGMMMGFILLLLYAVFLLKEKEKVIKLITENKIDPSVLVDLAHVHDPHLMATF